MKKVANQTKGQNSECVFCKIVSGTIPCKKVKETDTVLAFLSTAGDFENHTLVVPKVHVQNILDCPKNVLFDCLEEVQKIAQSYVSSGYDGVNVFVNNGEAAEQSVMHFHVHVVPRKINDGYEVSPK